MEVEGAYRDIGGERNQGRRRGIETLPEFQYSKQMMTCVCYIKNISEEVDDGRGVERERGICVYTQQLKRLHKNVPLFLFFIRRFLCFSTCQVLVRPAR